MESEDDGIFDDNRGKYTILFYFLVFIVYKIVDREVSAVCLDCGSILTLMDELRVRAGKHS